MSINDVYLFLLLSGWCKACRFNSTVVALSIPSDVLRSAHDILIIDVISPQVGNGWQNLVNSVWMFMLSSTYCRRETASCLLEKSIVSSFITVQHFPEIFSEPSLMSLKVIISIISCWVTGFVNLSWVIFSYFEIWGSDSVCKQDS